MEDKDNINKDGNNRKKNNSDRIVVETLQSTISSMFDGQVNKTVRLNVQIKEKLYKVEKVSRALDESATTLKSLEVFRALEDDRYESIGAGMKKRRLLPSRAAVQQFNRYLEAGMALQIDTKISRDKSIVWFDVRDQLRVLIKAHGMDKLAEYTVSKTEMQEGVRPGKQIDFAFGQDGLMVNTHSGAIASLLKVTDSYMLRKTVEQYSWLRRPAVPNDPK